MQSERNQLIEKLTMHKRDTQQQQLQPDGSDENTLDALTFEKDLLEDCFNFAFQYGLPMDKVFFFVEFFQDLINDTVKKGQPIF